MIHRGGWVKRGERFREDEYVEAPCKLELLGANLASLFQLRRKYNGSAVPLGFFSSSRVLGVVIRADPFSSSSILSVLFLRELPPGAPSACLTGLRHLESKLHEKVADPRRSELGQASSTKPQLIPWLRRFSHLHLHFTVQGGRLRGPSEGGVWEGELYLGDEIRPHRARNAGPPQRPRRCRGCPRARARPGP